MRVYADNAATTKMSAVAINAMLPYFDKVYGNPSSLHSVGQEAKEALDAARETVARLIVGGWRVMFFSPGEAVELERRAVGQGRCDGRYLT